GAVSGRTGWRRLTVHHWFLLVLAAMMIVVTVFGLIGAVMLERTTHLTTELVDRISPARIEAAELEGTLLDQENGVRGYPPTGNRRFLEPYEHGLADERVPYEHVVELTGAPAPLPPDPRQSREAAVAWRQEYAEPLLAERRADRPITTAQMEAGKPAFDRIRASVNALNDSLARTRIEARDEL